MLRACELKACVLLYCRYHSADNVTNVKTYTTGNINLARSWYYDSTFTMVNKVNMSGTEFQMVWGVSRRTHTHARTHAYTHSHARV